MDNFTIEEYSVLSATDIRLKTTDGEYWYPIVSFSKNMLFRRVRATDYRDKDFYKDHMKVFEILRPTSITGLPVKTWCMDTEGIYYLLLHTYIQPEGSKKKILMREKYLAAVRNFFGVKTTSDTPTFISYTPDLSNYDVWSIMCITRDRTIKQDTIWQRCNECGFYYPYTTRYFQKFKTQLARKCKECAGMSFTCMNRRIQYIKNNKGLDLLYQLYQGDNNKIAEEFKKWLSGGGV